MLVLVVAVLVVVVVATAEGVRRRVAKKVNSVRLKT